MIFAFILTCTVRTIEEQAAFYAQEREDIAAVNALRRLAGMPPIQMGTNRIVTHARPGIPCTTLRALAFDVVPLDAGKPIWNVFDPVWQRVGRTGKGMRTRMDGGLEETQGVCPFPVHGLSLAENREGKRPATSRSAVSGRSPALILQMWETTRSCGR